MFEQYRAGLDEGRPQARASLGMIGNKYTVDWSAYAQVDWTERVSTGVELARLRALGERITTLPQGFTLHPRVAQLMANRRRMVQGELPLDWGCAETLAYAALLEDGFGCASAARTAAAARSFIATRCCTTSSTDATWIPLQHVADDAAARADHRFGAVGRGGARLRVRLLDHRARLTGGVGGSVRRFRQRRAGDHRPVHQLGRSEVGALLRHRAVPAARLRGGRTRALLGAPRALPATVRREQHAGVRALYAGADVSHAAPADAATVSQAADRDDPEEPAASRAVGFGARGADARRLRARDRRDRRAAGRRRCAAWCSAAARFTSTC